MKKFKLTWTERVYDCESDLLYLEEKSQVIEAESEDVACDVWEKENEWNGDQNGLSSCVEIVKHELFKKHLTIEMPDGHMYAVKIEFIARHRARYYAHRYGNDVTESLIKDTLPLFETSGFEIHEWASNNMNWCDVENVALKIHKKIDEDEFQDAWVNGEWGIK